MDVRAIALLLALSAVAYAQPAEDEGPGVGDAVEVGGTAAELGHDAVKAREGAKAVDAVEALAPAAAHGDELLKGAAHGDELLKSASFLDEAVELIAKGGWKLIAGVGAGLAFVLGRRKKS